MDCVWTDQCALPRTVSRFNKDNDPNVYFCRVTEAEDISGGWRCRRRRRRPSVTAAVAFRVKVTQIRET